MSSMTNVSVVNPNGSFSPNNPEDTLINVSVNPNTATKNNGRSIQSSVHKYMYSRKGGNLNGGNLNGKGGNTGGIGNPQEESNSNCPTSNSPSRMGGNVVKGIKDEENVGDQEASLDSRNGVYANHLGRQNGTHMKNQFAHFARVANANRANGSNLPYDADLIGSENPANIVDFEKKGSTNSSIPPGVLEYLNYCRKYGNGYGSGDHGKEEEEEFYTMNAVSPKRAAALLKDGVNGDDNTGKGRIQRSNMAYHHSSGKYSDHRVRGGIIPTYGKEKMMSLANGKNMINGNVTSSTTMSKDGSHYGSLRHEHKSSRLYLNREFNPMGEEEEDDEVDDEDDGGMKWQRFKNKKKSTSSGYPMMSGTSYGVGKAFHNAGAMHSGSHFDDPNDYYHGGMYSTNGGSRMGDDLEMDDPSARIHSQIGKGAYYHGLSLRDYPKLSRGISKRGRGGRKKRSESGIRSIAVTGREEQHAIRSCTSRRASGRAMCRSVRRGSRLNSLRGSRRIGRGGSAVGAATLGASISTSVDTNIDMNVGTNVDMNVDMNVGMNVGMNAVTNVGTNVGLNYSASSALPAPTDGKAEPSNYHFFNASFSFVKKEYNFNSSIRRNYISFRSNYYGNRKLWLKLNMRKRAAGGGVVPGMSGSAGTGARGEGRSYYQMGGNFGPSGDTEGTAVGSFPYARGGVRTEQEENDVVLMREGMTDGEDDEENYDINTNVKRKRRKRRKGILTVGYGKTKGTRGKKRLCTEDRKRAIGGVGRGGGRGRGRGAGLSRGTISTASRLHSSSLGMRLTGTIRGSSNVTHRYKSSSAVLHNGDANIMTSERNDDVMNSNSVEELADEPFLNDISRAYQTDDECIYKAITKRETQKRKEEETEVELCCENTHLCKYLSDDDITYELYSNYFFKTAESVSVASYLRYFKILNKKGLKMKAKRMVPKLSFNYETFLTSIVTTNERKTGAEAKSDVAKLGNETEDTKEPEGTIDQSGETCEEMETKEDAAPGGDKSDKLDKVDQANQSSTEKRTLEQLLDANREDLLECTPMNPIFLFFIQNSTLVTCFESVLKKKVVQTKYISCLRGVLLQLREKFGDVVLCSPHYRGRGGRLAHHYNEGYTQGELEDGGKHFKQGYEGEESGVNTADLINLANSSELMGTYSTRGLKGKNIDMVADGDAGATATTTSGTATLGGEKKRVRGSGRGGASSGNTTRRGRGSGLTSGRGRGRGAAAAAAAAAAALGPVTNGYSLRRKGPNGEKFRYFNFEQKYNHKYFINDDAYPTKEACLSGKRRRTLQEQQEAMQSMQSSMQRFYNRGGGEDYDDMEGMGPHHHMMRGDINRTTTGINYNDPLSGSHFSIKGELKDGNEESYNYNMEEMGRKKGGRGGMHLMGDHNNGENSEYHQHGIMMDIKDEFSLENHHHGLRMATTTTTTPCVDTDGGKSSVGGMEGANDIGENEEGDLNTPSSTNENSMVAVDGKVRYKSKGHQKAEGGKIKRRRRSHFNRNHEMMRTYGGMMKDNPNSYMYKNYGANKKANNYSCLNYKEIKDMLKDLTVLKSGLNWKTYKMEDVPSELYKNIRPINQRVTGFKTVLLVDELFERLWEFPNTDVIKVRTVTRGDQFIGDVRIDFYYRQSERTLCRSCGRHILKQKFATEHYQRNINCWKEVMWRLGIPELHYYNSVRNDFFDSRVLNMDNNNEQVVLDRTLTLYNQELIKKATDFVNDELKYYEENIVTKPRKSKGANQCFELDILILDNNNIILPTVKSELDEPYFEISGIYPNNGFPDGNYSKNFCFIKITFNKLGGMVLRDLFTLECEFLVDWGDNLLIQAKKYTLHEVYGTTDSHDIQLRNLYDQGFAYLRCNVPQKTNGKVLLKVRIPKTVWHYWEAVADETLKIHYEFLDKHNVCRQLLFCSYLDNVNKNYGAYVKNSKGGGAICASNYDMDNDGGSCNNDHRMDPSLDRGIDPSIDRGVDHRIDHGVDHGMDPSMENDVENSMDNSIEHYPPYHSHHHSHHHHHNGRGEHHGSDHHGVHHSHHHHHGSDHHGSDHHGRDHHGRDHHGRHHHRSGHHHAHHDRNESNSISYDYAKMDEEYPHRTSYVEGKKSKAASSNANGSNNNNNNNSGSSGGNHHHSSEHISGGGKGMHYGYSSSKSQMNNHSSSVNTGRGMYCQNSSYSNMDYPLVNNAPPHQNFPNYGMQNDSDTNYSKNYDQYGSHMDLNY
ncbi:Uncharacterized protein PCOAH_00042890 [Plasmodium coatneyi]|uniref:Uncharacterized protein n=1 Tax=Plasmodium coatneyi TaxID=208452 RepID=A0A1B1E4S5_9APIC|nr:Uncharacterized protein PCOAH_00042890 [Plasmodium coatneyi]ANQ10008.1 Uncharacterized protein PCOAH_00042890 [Plasmodium coatneyi]